MKRFHKRDRLTFDDFLLLLAYPGYFIGGFLVLALVIDEENIGVQFILGWFLLSVVINHINTERNYRGEINRLKEKIRKLNTKSQSD